ncbi:TonB-dependent receptor [Salibacteraceae bacterium]|nr:TonB-dependent receptor [Salibacteraceae bacterium]
MRAYLILLFFLFPLFSFGQNVSGQLLDGRSPVPFASVGIVGTQLGASSDYNGNFILRDLKPGTYTLYFSCMGYKADSLDVTVSTTNVHLGDVQLKPSSLGLNELVVSGTLRTVHLSNSAVRIEVVNSKQLLKSMAPANLMESLGMINGVQEVLSCGVCYTNAISINGLPGNYTAVLIDGSPLYGNLASVYGLNGIPIQILDRYEVIKGPNSTLYGSEAMAGVINIITKDPAKQPDFSADVMVTSHMESFGNIAIAGGKGKWKQFTGLNYGYINDYDDLNQDGFGDMINLDRIGLFSKWSYDMQDGKKLVVNLKGFYEDRRNGVQEYLDDRAYRDIRGNDSIYGESILTERIELFGHYDLPTKKQMRLDYSFSKHIQDSYYGSDGYEALQDVGFGRLTWDERIKKHQLTSGLSLRYQFYNDNTVATSRLEGLKSVDAPDLQIIPGIFIQDEWTVNDRLTLLSGMRVDHYNKHGFIPSPRLSGKLKTGKWTNWRVNLGTGFKVVNLFAEDHAFVTGQREVVIQEKLRPEQSYSVSTSVNRIVNIGSSAGSFDLSAFYTHFTNKILPDYSEAGKILYANGKGQTISQGVSLSFSQEFEFPLSYQLGLNALEVFSQEEVNGILEKTPINFSSKWSGNLSVNYRIKKHEIILAATSRFNGPMHLPEVFDFESNGELSDISRPRLSQPFLLQNVQITKVFVKSRFELYAGIANLFNFLPPFSPLVGFNDPNAAPGFSKSFDTAYAYAPFHGREVYLGVRWNYTRKK